MHEMIYIFLRKKMNYIRASCKFIDQNINDFKMFWGDPSLPLLIKGYS
jgi:hypothetical protein